MIACRFAGGSRIAVIFLSLGTVIEILLYFEHFPHVDIVNRRKRVRSVDKSPPVLA